jgi:hypothetical protein
VSVVDHFLVVLDTDDLFDELQLEAGSGDILYLA